MTHYPPRTLVKIDFNDYKRQCVKFSLCVIMNAFEFADLISKYDDVEGYWIKYPNGQSFFIEV